MPEYTTARPSFERVLNAVEDAGLHVTYRNDTQASFQTPGHSANDRGTSVTYNGKQTLIYCHNGDTDDVLNALGLTVRDLFDEENGARYDYGDGRIVCRDPKKVFKQLGNTKGTNLYGLDSLSNDGPVYVVEGEKDADTATTVWGAAAVSQAQGANTGPERADWKPLQGRDVVIVADKDTSGRKRADKVLTYLTGMAPRPETVTIVEPAEGKDLSDHIAAGHTADELVDQGAKIGRRRVKLTPATSIKTETIDWVIDQWIPAGMLTLLAGREGIGKSTIACDWVSMLSKKGVKCAYLNSEDSRSYTVKPRLQAAGANLDNVFFIDVETETGNEGHLTLPQDTNLLFDELNDQGVKFVVLDAAKSSMDPKLDGYKDDHVRQFLEPLSAAADKYGITIVGLAHFGKAEGKDTGKLLLGSIAWSQIARSVLSAAVDEEDRLIVTNTKANLAHGTVSREASLVSRPVVLDDGTMTELGAIEWGAFTETSAVELLSSVVTDDDQDDRTDAEIWLTDYLTERGPTPRAEVLKAAAKARVASERTIKRAFKKLNGVSESQGFPRVATWSLPSGDIRDKTTLHTNKGGPTVPTGDDLQKQSGPTEGEMQLGHGPKSGPTEQIFQLDHPQESDPTERISRQDPRLGHVTDETRAAVLDVLYDQFGQSPAVVKSSLTQDQIAEIGDLDNYLNTLADDGLIARDNKGKYLKPKETA
ncbi:AAA family ATPase [Corynebacterium striatum]|uniref:AAA family ATPase n=1 Tax=Corynebacterium striatum TaxID=43770 RepID=UPI00254B91C6|nr:AAA family ATPase [Corynebacterium striatum]MDK8831613.1 AAA family ATPase [Corynebacterium striatum]